VELTTLTANHKSQKNDFKTAVYKSCVSVATYIASFPEAHGEILATHQYRPQKQLLFHFQHQLTCKPSE